MKLYPLITRLGDSAITIQIDSQMSEKANHLVHQFANFLIENPIVGMLEVVPAFFTLTVFYDPFIVHLYAPDVLPSQTVEKELLRCYQIIINLPITSLKTIEIELPICYGGIFGPDLMEVASQQKLTPQEVIHLHSEATYHVLMLGFSPGFAYLGGLNKKLFTPRKASPRLKIPAGSLGIGGFQTAVYPLETPGGWNIIGCTPLDMFKPNDENPSLLKPGYTVRFIPILEKEFEELRKNKDVYRSRYARNA